MTSPLQKIDDKTIVSSRTLNAPVDFVYGAFSHPRLLERWWGPEGFRNTITEFEFRVGGSCKITMHAPDGTDFDNESVFLEIEEAKKIVIEHFLPVHHFVMTMDFSADGERTHVTWTMNFDSKEDADRYRDFIVEANQQNFDRLQAVLATPVS